MERFSRISSILKGFGILLTKNGYNVSVILLTSEILAAAYRIAVELFRSASDEHISDVNR